MAIYHCNCKVISRGQGRSAVGAAAYRSGEKITNDYDGITHDYTNKGGVVYSEIMLPENAPSEWQDRATLWNEVERIEKGSRAQLAREYEVALPRELSREEQIQLVRDFVKENFVSKGMCADFAIHDKEDGNPHAHILLTTRPIERDGTWGKKAENTYVLDKDGNRILQKIDKNNRKIYKRIKTPTTDWDSKEFLQRNRESWAAAINRELERKNIPQRVDHRSLADQQKDRIPTEHIGVAAKNMEKRGEVSDRGERHREIQRANSELEQIGRTGRNLQAQIKLQDILSKAERIGGAVMLDVVTDTEKRLELQPKVSDQQRAVLRKEIQENLDNLSFIAKNKVYSYEQIETTVSDLWQKHNACALELDKARRLVSMGGGSAERELQIENLSQQLATVRAAIADYQKCGEVLHRIDRDNGGARAQTFRRLETLMKEQGRTAQPALQGAAARGPEQARTGRARADLPQAEARPRPFDVAAAARELEASRRLFAQFTAQGMGRTVYQENPAYRQQAALMEDYMKNISGFQTTAHELRIEYNKLGAFQGKRKKELTDQIRDFEGRAKETMEKLKAVCPSAFEGGTYKPERVTEAIKEKQIRAAQEREKVQSAAVHATASEIAQKYKAAFMEQAAKVPEEYRAAVMEKMQAMRTEPTREPGVSAVEVYKAEIMARTELDGILTGKKPEAARGPAPEQAAPIGAEQSTPQAPAKPGQRSMDEVRQRIAETRKQEGQKPGQRPARTHRGDENRDR